MSEQLNSNPYDKLPTNKDLGWARKELGVGKRDKGLIGVADPEAVLVVASSLGEPSNMVGIPGMAGHRQHQDTTALTRYSRLSRGKNYVSDRELIVPNAMIDSFKELSYIDIASDGLPVTDEIEKYFKVYREYVKSAVSAHRPLPDDIKMWDKICERGLVGRQEWISGQYARLLVENKSSGWLCEKLPDNTTWLTSSYDPAALWAAALKAVPGDVSLETPGDVKVREAIGKYIDSAAYLAEKTGTVNGVDGLLIVDEWHRLNSNQPRMSHLTEEQLVSGGKYLLRLEEARKKRAERRPAARVKALGGRVVEKLAKIRI